MYPTLKLYQLKQKSLGSIKIYRKLHLIHQFRLIIRDWQIHEFEHFMSLNISFMSNYTVRTILFSQQTLIFCVRTYVILIIFLIIKNIIAARRAVLFSKMEIFRAFVSSFPWLAITIGDNEHFYICYHLVSRRIIRSPTNYMFYDFSSI